MGCSLLKYHMLSAPHSLNIRCSKTLVGCVSIHTIAIEIACDSLLHYYINSLLQLQANLPNSPSDKTQLAMEITYSISQGLTNCQMEYQRPCICSPIGHQLVKWSSSLKKHHKTMRLLQQSFLHYYPSSYSNYFIHHLHCTENKVYPAGYYKAVIS